MKTMKYILMLVMGLMLPLTVTANDPISVSTGAMSNYMARGTTQSQGQPTVFGNINYTKDSFYAGTFFSNIDFADGTEYEYDFWIGTIQTVDKWTLGYSILFYGYINAPVNYNMVEGKFTATRLINDDFSLFFTGAFTPDYFNVSGPSLWSELGFSYAFLPKMKLTGSVGNQYIIQDWGTYNTANIGVIYQICSKTSIDFRYSTTDRDDLGKYYFAAFAVVVRVTF